MQCQLLLLNDSILSIGMQLFFKKASLKYPLVRLAKRRRWDSDAVAKEGNGSGTVSFHECEDEDEEEDDAHDDGGDGHEKMMWERDGLGLRSMPIALAIEANLYESFTNS